MRDCGSAGRVAGGVKAEAYSYTCFQEIDDTEAFPHMGLL